MPVQSQPVIVGPPAAAVIIVLTIESGREQQVSDALTGVTGIMRAVSFRAPEAELTCVVGIGADAWDRLFDLPRPRDLHRFAPLAGPTHHAPSTAGDLILHVRGQRFDLCFELARQLLAPFGRAVTVVDEIHGFTYLDQRDLLGFVDGTESPKGAEGAATVFIDDEPGHEGASYLIVQKYLHDMEAWNALSVEQQELVIGRRKLDDIELPDDAKPSNSHLALNTITDDDGNELDIVRENMPFGRLGSDEFGTYFIGYAADPGVIEHMLRNMFLGDPPGNHDRILDFSTAVTGSLFYVPTLDFLDDPESASTASASS
ncbi:Dyp-type peroxidase [Aeromicrobium sp. YIM 150415]|uniref:Dyp-type peroxidase n=1 Tax=Aeromicrobium sp. YIM 150415 TaxID=2803912 RepID=UPI0019663A89|nr:Dyp-type peroxidase [Aeromicrobium sp. YIM 150415]MBM9465001.1 Dyp-type peroxidase [Aeromicrobium sp. YIM 150415]